MPGALPRPSNGALCGTIGNSEYPLTYIASAARSKAEESDIAQSQSAAMCCQSARLGLIQKSRDAAWISARERSCLNVGCAVLRKNTLPSSNTRAMRLAAHLFVKLAGSAENGVGGDRRVLGRLNPAPTRLRTLRVGIIKIGLHQTSFSCFASLAAPTAGFACVGYAALTPPGAMQLACMKAARSSRR